MLFPNLMYIPHLHKIKDFIFNNREKDKQKSDLISKVIFGKVTAALKVAKI